MFKKNDITPLTIESITNEGSGMGRSESDLRKLCPDATVEQGLSIHGAEAAASKAKVERWLQNQL